MRLAAEIVGARRVWHSRMVIPLGAFLLGLVIGSFLNVCILRIPADKSIVLPASSCPKCGKAIAPYDNIPVLSWIFLGGKCRNCKAKISAMYPAVELLTGLLFLACYFAFGPTVEALKWAVFSALLVVLTITDLRERILPDEVNFFGLGAGLLFSFFTKPLDGTALWIVKPLVRFSAPAGRRFPLRTRSSERWPAAVCCGSSPRDIFACAAAKAWGWAT